MVKVNLATSLDGFVARLDGSLDWLPQPGDAPEGEDFGFAAFLAGVDRLVLGRATFEAVLGFGEWPYGELRTEVPLVVSERLVQVKAASGDPEHLVDELTLTRVPVLLGTGLALPGRSGFGPLGAPGNRYPDRRDGAKSLRKTALLPL